MEITQDQMTFELIEEHFDRFDKMSRKEFEDIVNNAREVISIRNSNDTSQEKAE